MCTNAADTLFRSRLLSLASSGTSSNASLMASLQSELFAIGSRSRIPTPRSLASIPSWPLLDHKMSLRRSSHPEQRFSELFLP